MHAGAHWVPGGQQRCVLLTSATPSLPTHGHSEQGHVCWRHAVVPMTGHLRGHGKARTTHRPLSAQRGILKTLSLFSWVVFLGSCQGTNWESSDHTSCISSGRARVKMLSLTHMGMTVCRCVCPPAWVVNYADGWPRARAKRRGVAGRGGPGFHWAPPWPVLRKWTRWAGSVASAPPVLDAGEGPAMSVLAH